MHPTLSPLTPRRLALGLLCASAAGAWAQSSGAAYEFQAFIYVFCFVVCFYNTHLWHTHSRG